MKHSVVRVTLAVYVDHPEDLDPLEIIDQSDYEFKSTVLETKITDYEIREVELYEARTTIFRDHS